MNGLFQGIRRRLSDESYHAVLVTRYQGKVSKLVYFLNNLPNDKA